jgi:hypothetical protein
MSFLLFVSLRTAWPSENQWWIAVRLAKLARCMRLKLYAVPAGIRPQGEWVYPPRFQLKSGALFAGGLWTRRRTFDCCSRSRRRVGR